MNTDNLFNYMFKPDWAAMWERGIKEAWADEMVNKHGSIKKAWDNYAREYEEGEIRYSNRVELVERILDSGPDRVLDIGGGTGVFAIPIARHVKRVVVVEPSEGMLEILKEKAKKEGLDNIVYVMKRWEEVSKEEVLALNDGNAYDAVLASHSIYYIGDLHRSFLKMNDVVKGYVYLFTGCSGYTRDRSYEKLYLILHKKPLPPYPDYSCIYMILREIGIQPNIEMVSAKVNRPIRNIEEVIDRWKGYLGKEDLSREEEEAIREYLSDKIKEENGQLYHYCEYKNALIYWKFERDIKEAAI